MRHAAPFFSWGFFIFGLNKMMRINFYLRTGHAGVLCAFAAIFLCAPVLRGAQTAPPVAQTNIEGAKSGAPLIVKDDKGRQVEVPQPLKRIISLAPSVTETIYALGAQDRLVADTDVCNYPPAAQKLPKIGGPFTPNLEVIVSLKPDLVVVAADSGNRKETADALDLLHVPTYATSAKTVDEVLASIVKLGDVLGNGEQGRTLSESLRARLQDLHHRLENVTPTRVLFVVWQEPLMSIGQDTYIADALRHAGAESVVQTKQDWPRVSWEEVVRLQPTYLVFASAHPEEITAMMAGMRNLPGWRDLKAVEENKIVIVSEAINLPAPRLVDSIEELARHLHPEAFIDAPHVPAATVNLAKHSVAHAAESAQ
jgi:cobalamin transport system substrate-binding protein